VASTTSSRIGARAVLPLVGRVAELRDFEADLEAAQDGPSRLLVVSGRHGTGKSRLLEEFVDTARHHRFVVASARGLDQTGSPPLCCWRQIIGDLLDGLDPIVSPRNLSVLA
jgi:predicted ATPase